jgi:putative NADH-flavin reductase
MISWLRPLAMYTMVGDVRFPSIDIGPGRSRCFAAMHLVRQHGDSRGNAYVVSMKITIFGASRGVGRAAVESAAARGHAVTAVARHPGTLRDSAAAVVIGDVLEEATVDEALAGADAVLVALGTAPSKADRGAQREVCSRGTAAILAGMQRRALERIVVVTSYGVGPTAARRPFPFNLVAATLLRDIMQDKERQEALIRASATQWTIAQPLGLTDAPATGKPFVSNDGTRQLTRVTRADVAEVCVHNAIENGSYVRETIAISAAR